jgi:hypothetical protein
LRFTNIRTIYKSFLSIVKKRKGALSFPAKAAALCVGENPRAIESDFGWFTSCGEVCRPERLDRFFALCREWGEITAFKTAKAKWQALQSESMLRTKTGSKLAGIRRIRQRAGRYEKVGTHFLTAYRPLALKAFVYCSSADT